VTIFLQFRSTLDFRTPSFRPFLKNIPAQEIFCVRSLAGLAFCPALLRTSPLLLKQRFVEYNHLPPNSLSSPTIPVASLKLPPPRYAPLRSATPPGKQILPFFLPFNCHLFYVMGQQALFQPPSPFIPRERFSVKDGLPSSLSKPISLTFPSILIRTLQRGGFLLKYSDPTYFLLLNSFHRFLPPLALRDSNAPFRATPSPNMPSPISSLRLFFP